VSDLSALGRNNALGSVSLVSPNVGLSILLVVGGGMYMLSRRIPFVSLPGGVLLVLLLLTGILGMLRAPNHLDSLYQWLRVASDVIPYALAASLFVSKRRIQTALDALALSFVLPAGYGLYQLITHHGYVQEGQNILRVQGTFIHPNAFGIFLVMLFGIFFCQFQVQRGGRKLVAAAIVAVSALLILETYARVAWVGAALVMITAGIVTKRPAILGLAAVGLLAVILSPSLSHRAADFSTMFSPGGGGSLADRIDIWQKTYPTWLLLTENPMSGLATLLNRFVGTGPGSVEFLTLRGYGVAYAAHNDYLATLISFGIFGLTMYLLMYAVLLHWAYRSWRAAQDPVLRALPLSLFALVLAVLVMSLTDNIIGGTQNQLYFWTLAGLAVAAAKIRARERAAAEAPAEPGQLRRDRMPARPASRPAVRPGGVALR
jgi:O-antigen ligase